MPQTRWTLATFVRLHRFCRPVCARRTRKTAAEVHSLVAVDTDEHEIARIKIQCAAVKQACEIHAPTSDVDETNGQSCAGGRARTQWLAQC